MYTYKFISPTKKEIETNSIRNAIEIFYLEYINELDKKEENKNEESQNEENKKEESQNEEIQNEEIQNETQNETKNDNNKVDTQTNIDQTLTVNVTNDLSRYIYKFDIIPDIKNNKFKVKFTNKETNTTMLKIGDKKFPILKVLFEKHNAIEIKKNIDLVVKTMCSNYQIAEDKIIILETNDINNKINDIINKTADIINKTNIINATTDIINKTADIINKTTDIINKTTDTKEYKSELTFLILSHNKKIIEKHNAAKQSLKNLKFDVDINDLSDNLNYDFIKILKILKENNYSKNYNTLINDMLHNHMCISSPTGQPIKGENNNKPTASTNDKKPTNTNKPTTNNADKSTN